MRGTPARSAVVAPRGTVVTTLAVAATPWARCLGLMFVASLREGDGLLLAPCNQIHMLCMRIPLDVVFVDGEGRVVRLYENLRPWRMTRMVRKAKACLELPAGTIARTGVAVGDVLTLMPAS